MSEDTKNEELEVGEREANDLATFQNLVEVWDAVLSDLSPNARTFWKRGRWTTVTDGTAYFETPNVAFKKNCEKSLEEVEQQLWVHMDEPALGLDVKVVREEEPYVIDIEVNLEEFVRAALGQAIQDARKKAGLSQRVLGERVRADQTVISSWERAAAMPSIDRIFHLDLAFGLQPGTLLVRAGLVKREAIEAAMKRSDEQRPANVTKVSISMSDDRSPVGMELPPKLTVEQWLELARTMLGSEEDAARVSGVTVTAANGGDDSSMQLGSSEYSLEEVLRLIEIMIEAQGAYAHPWGGSKTYDPAEEPF